MICVGNIVAGGAGKTPTALALADLLQARGARPVFATRGYGGSEAGPLLVDPDRHDARAVGDEALLLARRAPVVVGRDRARAVRMAERCGTHIILDDGLQNPRLAPDLSLLVIDGAAGLGNGRLIPAGPMRETPAAALQRITAIVAIGGGAIDPRLQANGKPVLPARLEPVFAPDFPRAGRFLAFAGIGRPEKFFASCRAAGLTLRKAVGFADHHVFKPAELARLRQEAAALDAQLLTTEKDFVRLPPQDRAGILALPVRLVFAAAEREKLDALLSSLSTLP